jgi:predicted  nucleic acid-binding Zn-ribbon protein
MAGLTDLFREIHRLRRFAHDLKEQVDRVPRQLKTQQTKVARQEELLRQGQDAIKHLKVSIHEKEVSLKTAHQQTTKHERQLNEAASKKEYDALKAEIAQGREQCQRLEDEILQAMSDVEERTAKLPALEQGVRQAKEEYARYEKGVDERLANLKAQLADAQGQLQQIETELPADLRQQFDRVVNAMGPDALAAVVNRTTCSSCYTEITAQNYNDLQIGNLVMCKACGRILYLPTAP